MTVRNPMPAAGGAETEPIEQVRQFTPQAFRVQERAVTEDDYAAAAALVFAGPARGRHPALDRLLVHRVRHRRPARRRRADPQVFGAELEPYRMAGSDVVVQPPAYVPLDIGLTVYVAAGDFRGTVKLALIQVFRPGTCRAVTAGIFDPGNFTLRHAGVPRGGRRPPWRSPEWRGWTSSSSRRRAVWWARVRTPAAAGITPADPGHQRPGLSAIAYRSGTHGTVLRRMLAVLGSRSRRTWIPGWSDDPAVALLDAWATVADVVTFYQERIANEGFLRTATERRSVLELARAIGYELRPGVAAATYLDFRIQEPAAAAPAPGPAAPRSAAVEQGTRVLSVPAQGKLPQPFETAQQFTAHASLNEIPLRTRTKQTLHTK